MEPKISIITVCYNAEDAIEVTILSVLKQDYKNVEYLIIDGLSEDNTMSIVDKYKSYIDVVISEKDNGISDAFNKGIKFASGELICFLNAGDTFLDKKVLSTVAKDWLEKKVDILFYIMKAGKFGFTPSENYHNDSSKIWNDMAIPHQACFCRKKVFSEIGNFDLTLKIRMDYDFFARCVKAGTTYRYISKVITNYDDNGVSAIPKNRVLFLQEGLAIKKKYRFNVTLKERLKLIKWKLLSWKIRG